MLKEGTTAPPFTLRNQWGELTSLSDYRGDWVLVWWIPSTVVEMTPMCCDQIAKGLGQAVDAHPELNVIGLSFDTPEQMMKFSQRGAITFPLLSDSTQTVGTEYGVRRYDEWDCFPRKVSFLVDPEGTIVRVYKTVDPDFHVEEVVADLMELNPKPVEKPSFFKRLVGIK